MSACLNKSQELPQDAVAWEVWVQAIFRLGDFEDTRENRAALARALMHLPNDICEKPLGYFVTSLKRSHAQFAAHDEIQRLKAEDEAEKAAQAEEPQGPAQEGNDEPPAPPV